jgi:peptidoglycan/xylan/chitin deacetylase (PgdA/CDA1 family)
MHGTGRMHRPIEHRDSPGRSWPNVKAAALQIATASGIANFFRPLTKDVGVVFMLHRFAESCEGIAGHSPTSVRALLACLRRERHQLVDLTTLLAAFRGEIPPLRHAVAFTIDDGYHEHASVAAPLFADFDCPVTTFVTTGFLDGSIWFWWDQIEYVLTQTLAKAIEIEIQNHTVRYDLSGSGLAVRTKAAADVAARCKALTAQDRTETIARLARVAEVSIPPKPPSKYSPMTWSELRRAEQLGMTFGPHTVTHPFLSRLSDEQAREEIVGSWTRLRAEATRPVPVFAYPNGQRGDFGVREFRLLSEAGLTGAVTANVGFVLRELLRLPNGPFALPRISFPTSLPDLIQQVDGLERFKSWLRGGSAPSLAPHNV